MAKWDLVPYEEWKQVFLADIDGQPHTVAKGDRFVSKFLQIYYTLSESDAIDATDCAGPNDHGVDAIFIFPEDKNESSVGLAVQGKYGVAGKQVQMYTEAEKFLTALKSAYEGEYITPAINKLASVLSRGDPVHYVTLTIEALKAKQKKDFENVKKMAFIDFGERLTIEAINLKDIYAALGTKNDDIFVDLSCQVVQAADTYVGMVKLTDMYKMMSSYVTQTNGSIDRIYDYNLRKYIKRRKGSVNDGIYHTLMDQPERFLAYNNGITLICYSARSFESGLQLQNPYIVNGCQTTRTLYDFMEQKFVGRNTPDGPGIGQFQEAFLVIKVLVVTDMDGDNSYAKNITRYSNTQNAIGKRDFIALEDKYKELKTQMGRLGYFLEIQKGEYEALPKSKKIRFSESHLINSFEATLFFAAGLLGKPHLTFGHSAYFAPGGSEYDEIVGTLTVDDLYVPWLIARHAADKGYVAKSRTSRGASNETAHRVQTRYLFLYIFFRLTQEIIAELVPEKDANRARANMYHILKELEKSYRQNPQAEHPFAQLITLTDETIFTLIGMVEKEEGYKDRASFLESPKAIENAYIRPAIGPAQLRAFKLIKQLQPFVKR